MKKQPAIDVPASVETTALTKAVPASGQLTKRDIEILTSVGVIPKDTPPDVVAFFGKLCAETRLSPFRRQICLISRNAREGDVYVKRFTPQLQIDGFRAQAERTGRYAGSDDYRFDEGLGEFQMVQAGRPGPTTATATVYKLIGGQRCPFTATAKWTEYCPPEKQAFMWNKMPFLMLGKCAEALALRKAFPEELSGMYAEEEMGNLNLAVNEPLTRTTEYLPPESEKQQVQTTVTSPPAEAPKEKTTEKTKAKPITDAYRKRMMDRLKANPNEEGYGMVSEFFAKLGWLIPGEGVENLSLIYVPKDQAQLKLLEAALNDFSSGLDIKEPYPPNQEVSTQPVSSPPARKAAPTPPLGQAPAAVKPDWRTFPFPFGRLAGKALGDLPQGLLREMYGSYKVKESWVDAKGQTRVRSKDQIAKDTAFRAALTEAGKELGFDQPAS